MASQWDVLKVSVNVAQRAVRKARLTAFQTDAVKAERRGAQTASQKASRTANQKASQTDTTMVAQTAAWKVDLMA